jgi:hypothetical protein
MNLPSKNFIVSKLGKYKGEKKVILYDQKANDIINELCKNHNINKSEYDKISRYFYHNDLVLTAKHLFDFCKKNINYVIERGTDQTLRSPGAILINGNADCKQYSQFIGGILDSINRLYQPVNWVYRFAAYNGNEEVQHVFVVMKYNNLEYWIDPVLNYFNEKKEYNFKKDKKMSLYQVSGINDNNEEIGSWLSDRFKHTWVERNVINKVRINDISINNVKNFVVKVATFPARQAFLAIVSINAFDLGKSIAKGILKDRAKIKKFWENVGGDFAALLRAVNNQQSQFKVSGSMIGLEPVTTTAAVVASPIIVAITAVLKEIGVDPKNLGDSLKKIVVDKTAEVIKNNGKAFIENGVNHIIENINGQPTLKIEAATQEEIKNNQDNGNNSNPPVTFEKKDNTLLYAGGAALALYLFTKK